MLTCQNFTYFQDEHYQLEASLYVANENKKNQTILYLHGGGLIWGSRHDLPESYIQLFVQAGYDFISLDYPLAPETDLAEILSKLELAFHWFQKEALTTLKLSSTNFHLFGRSAGAYLAFICAKNPNVPAPQKIISFYGYASINAAFYLEPNSFYQTYPLVPLNLVDALIQQKPIVTGSLEKRYGIYLYARQTGKWLDLVLKNQADSEKYSLSDEDLALLPPTFIAQSTADEDVPYRIGIDLSLAIPKAKFLSIQGLQHDFDQDFNEPQAKNAYQEAINWLNK
ncbi:alpha/beta hydrolase [Carnobacterium gallinarum]|uniref:alpha/beta hydrolase n=1 Tax=Carnobacterium gallinarum TaxID=2749 RepID=UPI00054F2A9F|nr:alpha/beta hydrolase [Carnobacterium gallinarum]